MLQRSRGGKLRDKTRPEPGDDDRWLETEWSEGSIHETRRPGRCKTVFMPERAEEPPPRSQSVHSSEEAG